MMKPSFGAKLLLLLLSLVFCAAAFITLDWFRTKAIRRSGASEVIENPCEVHDPARDHSFKANCAATAQWGAASYPFFTNSLGLRDQEVRQVQLVANKPRLLILGDSFTESMTSWSDSYPGMIAARFPQYDVLNGGVNGYSPSTYLNTERILQRAGVDFDEVMVFIDISDVQDEAAVYWDIDSSGAVALRPRQPWSFPQFEQRREWLSHNLMLTNDLVKLLQRALVSLGYYHLTLGLFGDTFDMGRSAWTYRDVDDTRGFYASGGAGYGPLGVERGILKEEQKMKLLWQELHARGIPLSVVVYPQPAQLAHDSVDSRQVLIWREWCEGKCKRFITLFPAFFAAKDQCPWFASGCWYGKYFIFGDAHYSREGNALVADVVSKNLQENPVTKHQQPNAQEAVKQAASNSRGAPF